MLLMLMILLCACTCLSAGASEEPGRKRLIVASVIGDEGEKCYYYRAPEESQKQIAGFYYPGAQVYMLEYGPEWCRVFLCAEGYMKTSQLKRTGAAKIEPIGFAFASFELAWTSFDRPSKRVALSSAQAGRIHPTQKPVALYAWIFQHYAKPGDRILDTHLGSGSSRIAAWDAGLDFTGYEIDPEYFEAQEKRFQQHTAQMSLFGGGGYLITIYIFRKMKATCAWC